MIFRLLGSLLCSILSYCSNAIVPLLSEQCMKKFYMCVSLHNTVCLHKLQIRESFQILLLWNRFLRVLSTFSWCLKVCRGTALVVWSDTFINSFRRVQTSPKIKYSKYISCYYAICVYKKQRRKHSKYISTFMLLFLQLFCNFLSLLLLPLLHGFFNKNIIG